VFDLIINNALIYDGSGAPAYHGSIGVKDGKIVAFSFTILPKQTLMFTLN
jgi:N-acyl-D-aspartate/D-glutamate deacylase